jgi:prophage regulatory protein
MPLSERTDLQNGHTPKRNEPSSSRELNAVVRRPAQRSLSTQPVAGTFEVSEVEPVLAESTFPNRHSSQKAFADGVVFLRLPKVKAITGLSKSSLYELIRTNSFPAPVHIGPRIVAWVMSEVQEWATDRISISRSTPPQQGGKKMPHGTGAQTWTSARKWA